MEELTNSGRGLKYWCGLYGCYGSSRPTWAYIVWPIVGGLIVMGLLLWALLYYRRRHRAFVAQPQPASTYTYPEYNQPVQGYPAYAPQPYNHGDYSTYGSNPGTSQGNPVTGGDNKPSGNVEMAPPGYPAAQNQYYAPPPNRPY